MKFYYLLFVILALTILSESRKLKSLRRKRILPLSQSFANVIKIAKTYSYENVNDINQDIDTNDDQKDFTLENEHVRGAVRVIFGVIEDTESYIVSFRGTQGGSDWESWMTNIKMTMKEETFCNQDLKIHSGFLNAYNKVKVKVLNKVIHNFTGKNSLKNLIITGHSLGGALATIAYAHINCSLINAKLGNNPHHKKLFLPNFSSLVTFGAPRAGNLMLARLVNQLSYDFNKSLNIRVTLGKDLVPQVPSKNDGECAYVHQGTEVKFDPMYRETSYNSYSEHVFTWYKFNVDQTHNFYDTLYEDLADLAKTHGQIGYNPFDYTNFVASSYEILKKYASQVQDHVSYDRIRDREFLESLIVFYDENKNKKPCENDDVPECTELNTQLKKAKKQDKDKDTKERK